MTQIHMQLCRNNQGSPPSLQLSQQLDSLLGMLCADVAPADGASIQQNLKLLEEKLQSVGVCAPSVDFCCKHFLFIVVRNETLPRSPLSSRLSSRLPG